MNIVNSLTALILRLVAFITDTPAQGVEVMSARSLQTLRAGGAARRVCAEAQVGVVSTGGAFPAPSPVPSRATGSETLSKELPSKSRRFVVFLGSHFSAKQSGRGDASARGPARRFGPARRDAPGERPRCHSLPCSGRRWSMAHGPRRSGVLLQSGMPRGLPPGEDAG